MDLSTFWAKTGRHLGWHPAVCHMVDVGQTARRLVEDGLVPWWRERLAVSLGVPEARLPAWIGFLAALHDLGKISPGFQAKCPTLFNPLLQQGYRASVADETNHALVTRAAVGDLLTQVGVSFDFAEALAYALGAHHGTVSHGPPKRMGDDSWQKARREAFRLLACALGVRPEEVSPPEALDPAATVVLAGLVSVSDWIASDVRYFPLANRMPEDLGAYAGRAYEQAQRALMNIRWRPPSHESSRADFGDLFHEGSGAGAAPWQPNAVQAACGRLAGQTSGPFLLVVEAPMGTGKTEAAIWAADLGASAQGRAGFYYALPTQATSNQMLGRLETFLRNRYPDEVTSLLLLHGLASLNDAFQKMRRRALDVREILPQYINDETGAVVAQEWFCGHKRGLLSPFAVGTVDQALLAALTTRHFFVRLFGLAGKTVIVDEVHAYDAYMSVLLERLIAWLSALGTSVILLSATLPAARRRQLIEAYTGARPPPADAPYPRVSLATAESAVCEHVAPDPGMRRTVGLMAWPDRATDVVAGLAHRLAEGGCAAWICNTVGRAQAAFRALRDAGGFADAELIPFHARYPVEERLQRERAVVDKFGKQGERPRKAVVVATQVIEQSLDLDFDFMVTDLAPVDLVLQRMGRLHRHPRGSRPGALSEAHLAYLEPQLSEAGLPEFGASGYVYDAYLLLRTYLVLRGVAQVTLPADMDPLIEAVYGNGPLNVPDAKVAEWMTELESRSLAERESNEARARKFILPRPQRCGGVFAAVELSPPDDDEMAQRLTRLAEPTITIVCVHETPQGLSLTPDGSAPVDLTAKPDRAGMLRLLSRSVRTGLPHWFRHFRDQPVPPGWEDIPLLRSCRLAVFRDGKLRAEGRTLFLDPTLGLYEEQSP